MFQQPPQPPQPPRHLHQHQNYLKVKAIENYNHSEEVHHLLQQYQDEKEEYTYIFQI